MSNYQELMDVVFGGPGLGFFGERGMMSLLNFSPETDSRDQLIDMIEEHIAKLLSQAWNPSITAKIAHARSQSFDGNAIDQVISHLFKIKGISLGAVAPVVKNATGAELIEGYESVALAFKEVEQGFLEISHGGNIVVLATGGTKPPALFFGEEGQAALEAFEARRLQRLIKLRDAWNDIQDGDLMALASTNSAFGDRKRMELNITMTLLSAIVNGRESAASSNSAPASDPFAGDDWSPEEQDLPQ